MMMVMVLDGENNEFTESGQSQTLLPVKYCQVSLSALCLCLSSRSPVALPREIRRGKDGRVRGEHLAGCRRLAALLRLQPPRLESRRRARRGWERSLRGGLHRAGLCFF